MAQSLMSYFLNSDGSVGSRSYTYEKAADGSLYATGENYYVPNAWPASFVEMKAQELSNYVNANFSILPNRVNGQNYVMTEEFIFLRYAVEKGLTTAEQVVKVLGDIPVDGASPLNFFIEFPSVVPAAYASKYTTGDLSTVFKLKDIFNLPIPLVDNSAIKGGSFPWSIPEGTTYQQQIAKQWANSSNEVISKIVTNEAVKSGNMAPDLSWKTDPYVNDAQKVYIAYFGRPADVEGIKTTEAQIRAANGDKAAITSMFANSAESQSFYGGKTVEQKVDTIYTQLFGRHAEQAGLDYWAHQLELGLIDQVTMGIKIADGAMLSDLATINNRVAAANLFTEHIDQTAYAGNQAASNGRMFLSSIGSDVGDLSKALAAVQSQSMSDHMMTGSIQSDIRLVGLTVGDFFVG